MHQGKRQAVSLVVVEIFICLCNFFRLLNEIRNVYERFNGAKMARAANHHFDNHHDSHIGIKWLETDVKVILVLTFYLQKHFNDYWGSKRQFAIDFHVSEFVLEFLLKIRTFENGENKKTKDSVICRVTGDFKAKKVQIIWG